MVTWVGIILLGLRSEDRSSGWLVENAKMRSGKLEKWWKNDGMLIEKIFGDSGVSRMKWYAVGESSFGKMNGK